MKNHLQTARALVVAAAALLFAVSADAQTNYTYVWADNAVGQPYLTCFSGPVGENFYWPSNSSWTQGYETNANCNDTAILESAPSNWDPADTNTPTLDSAAAVGVYPGGPGAINVNVILGLPANTYLTSDAHLVLNDLTIQPDGALSAGANWSIALNQIEFQGDGTLASGVGSILIGSGGAMIKSGGTNSFSILNASIVTTNDLIEVDCGTLIFPTGFGAAQLNGVTTITVSNNATLLLTTDINAVPFLNGTITGGGGGTVLFNNGSLGGAGCDLNFPGAMFQWTGGSMKGEGGAFTNSGVINITNLAPQFYGGVIFYNRNLVTLNDQSSLDFYSPSGAAPGLHNEASGTFNITGNSSLTTGDGTIYNSGRFVKSAGTGLSQITPVFQDLGGMIEVDSGTMALDLKGGGLFTNAVFVISNTAELELNISNVSTEIEGALTGSGGGTVLIDNGQMASGYQATLNFPGSMFQWAGGKLGTSGSGVPLTNLGTVNITGPVIESGTIANNGVILQSAAGSVGATAGFTGLNNNAGAVYDLQNDNGIAMTTFNNSGLFVKSAGVNTSLVTCSHFYDYGPGGSVEVDSGTLAFAGNNNYLFTNTAFVIGNGASLGLSISNNATEIEGPLSGSGGGTVFVNNGTVYSSYPTTLNFPGNMFQWQGGSLGNTSGLMTNLGFITITGPVGIDGILANNGTMIQTGAGSIGNNSILNNNAGAVYDIQNDNGLAINTVNNNGVFEKTGGTGTSLITANFNNSGVIQGLGGLLLFTNGTFTQNAGVLPLSATVSCQGSIQENGGVITGVGAEGNPGDVNMTVSGGAVAPGNPFGTLSFLGHYGFSMGNAAAFNVVLGGAGEFSQLQVPNSSAVVAGTLNVTLTNGYTPPIGTQFEIISGGSRGGTFATLHVPTGISVTYSNTGVYLTVTSAVPAQIESPQLSGGNFTFGFGTVNGQSYTVQATTNLAGNNWTYFTNLTGNGSLYQVIAPVTNLLGQFFRVREP